jgi:predicted ATPase
MELVERETQLAALGEHLDAAAAGEGRLVLVGGEAGVGKTMLIKAFAAERADEVRFVWAPNPSGLLFAWNPRVSC